MDVSLDSGFAGCCYVGNYCRLNQAMGCLAKPYEKPDVAQENRSNGGGKKKYRKERRRNTRFVGVDMITYY